MDFSTQAAETPEQPKHGGPATRRTLLFSFIALLVVLLVAGYFRTVGLMWGDYSYPHPDERFLVWVTADIAPVHSLGEYFNTAASTLNPANRGHQFYVYGDLPVILTRYLTEGLLKTAGWQEILQVGRALSALFDLLTVLLVFLIAERLAGWKVAAIAGLLSAGAVLQIQQAHFYTTDSFSTCFTTLALYLGVLIATEPDHIPPRRILGINLLFGLAVGLAMASKLNTAVVAVLLPAALFVRWLRDGKSGAERARLALDFAIFAALSGALAFITFRLAQPYAFKGPGLFNIGIDPAWLKSIRDLQAQSAGDVDFPPALQWARRTHLFSLQNMTLWGLGIPLGVMGWVGFLLFAWRAIGRLRTWMHGTRIPSFNGNGRTLVDRNVSGTGASGTGTRASVAEDDGKVDFWHSFAALLVGAWPGALMIWLWTGAYFLWQSMAWNSTMRYQLPIYPTLAILAAWGLGDLWNRPPWRGVGRLSPSRRPGLWRTGVTILGALVVLLTLAWAFAFTRIYTRPETRVAASRWIYQNVPGPLDLVGTSAGQPWQQLLLTRTTGSLRPGQPYLTWFLNDQTGALSVVHLPKTQVIYGGVNTANLVLRARIYDPAAPDQPLAIAGVSLPQPGSLDNLDLPVSGLPRLETGKRYGMAIEVASADSTPVSPDLPVTVNLDGAVTLGLYGKTQSLSYQGAGGAPVTLSLPDGGTLTQISLPAGVTPSPLSIMAINTAAGEQNASLAQPASYAASPLLTVQPPIVFKPGVSYQVSIGPAASGQMLGAGQAATLSFFDAPISQSIPPLVVEPRAGDPLWFTFGAAQDAEVSQLVLGHVEQVDPAVQGATGLTAQVFAGGNTSTPVARGHFSGNLSSGDARGASITLTLEQPVRLTANQTYAVSLTPDQGVLALRGSDIGNESTWDMGLPFRLDNYDPFGGIYTGGLFEMYWDDNADKLTRFINILDQSDYLGFSSNRQWGTTTRVPERYPLTTEFYRRLLGCPPDKDVVWCYRVAEPGMFHGDLGYDLVQTFTSYPNLGPLKANDQFAEEAFTVYDHAKVMIFKKQSGYNPAQVRAILGAVDLSKVVHLTPRTASGYKDLLLPARLWMIQQAGGAWNKLFPPGGLVNSSQAVSVVVWYVFLFVLGLAVYPILRLALPGLPDRGYPLARTLGLVILAYLAWLAGSLGAPVTRTLLAGVFALIVAAGLMSGYLQRAELREEWRARRGYILAVELAALALFAIDLAIRFGNPDLWHPIFGGEKPMDFSYFNAVLKSTVFPPYDPWFAGGYINYYYYGFVLVGMPVKLLGITPSVAYNLILPGLFMVVGLGAFSIGANLLLGTQRQQAEPEVVDDSDPAGPLADGPVADQPLIPLTSAEAADTAIPARRAVSTSALLQRQAILAGVAAVFALLLLGNLGTVRMFWQGWQKMVVPEAQMLQGNMVQHINWAAQGFVKWVQDPAQPWPYYPGDWYWKPSRAIEPETGNEITEFPLFTFLYADLHAHLIALPVTILVLGWALGVIFGLGRWGLRDGRLGWLSFGLAMLTGALAAGLLRPANTWDQYTYLALAALALAYAQWRGSWGKAPSLGSLARIVLPPLLLVGLAVLAYRPFDAWFAQGYNAVEAWKGDHTNINSYLTHWGLFLFVITAWLFEETVNWMAHTPLSALGRLRRYTQALVVAAAGLALLLVVLLAQGVSVALVAVPLGVWAALLIFRPGQPDAKRAVLFMIGTGLALTLVVELVVVKGDIGRQNTVFKFYYQAWTLLSLSAAAGLVWLWPRRLGWHSGWRNAWQVALAALVIGAAFFPLTATKAKIEDRMVADAPHTLDGMLYMNYAKYTDGLTQDNMREMDLSQDYRAIEWVQRNVPGSPVIVEANTPEYRHWGTRFTIYTGLPGVVGWSWHQRQQRTITPDTWVYDRIADIQSFYLTSDRTQAEAFLRRYNVQYIIVGQLERLWYPGPGLSKFTQLNGQLWDQVYAEGETVIYKVR